MSFRPTLALYRNSPFLTKLHIYIRSLTCPFEKIEKRVPRRGQILEIGCGHGFFSLYLALTSKERAITGIDIDQHKLTVAQKAAANLGSSEVVFATNLNPLLQRKWNCIIFIDVFYLMPTEQQRKLLQKCRRALAPGGKILIKEMSDRPAWKTWWNKLQESLAVKVFGITESEQKTRFYLTLPTVFKDWLSELDLSVTGTDLSKGYLHPHYLTVARLKSKVRS